MNFARHAVYDTTRRSYMISAPIVVRLNTLFNHAKGITLVHVAREVLRDIGGVE